MACLCIPLEGDRLAHKRVGDRSGVGVDNGSRPTFGVENLLPKRYGAQAAERRVVEVRPGQCRGVEATMAGDEVPTEALFVLVGSDFHRETGTMLGRHMRRRA